MKTRFNPSLAVTSDLVDPRRMRASHVYRNFYRAHEVEHHLMARLTPLEYPHPGVIAVVLARSERRGRFSETDGALLAQLVPSLTAAARRIERLRAVTDERDTLATLVARDGVYAAIELDGRARWLSRDAEADLGGGLPDELHPVLARLRDLVGRGGAAPAGGAGLVTFRNAQGETRALDAGLVRAGDGWLVALTLAAPGLPGPVARAAAHHGLRPSEARVLEALTRGQSNAEIARDLFVSTETVRTHVHHILRKMRVRRRLEAVARLRRFA